MQQLLTKEITENGVICKKCRLCGEYFEPTCNRQRYCKTCGIYVRNHRPRDRRMTRMRQRNSGKTPVNNGTFGNKYLKVNSEGRVNGALWLEQKRDYNGSGKKRGIKPPRDLSLFSKFDLLVVRGTIYCGECWSPVPFIIAPQNKHYSIRELCCGNCGLVIDLEKLWAG